MKNQEKYFFISLSFFYATLLFSLLNLFVWFFWKNKLERTRIRPTVMVMTVWLGLMLEATSTQVTEYFRLSFPCWLFTLILILAIPFVGAAILARFPLFYYYSLFSEQLASQARVNFIISYHLGMLAGKISRRTKMKSSRFHLLGKYS